MKQLLLVFFICLFGGFAFSQDVNVLRKKLESESNKLEVASKLRDFYQDESVDSLFSLGRYLLKEGIEQDNQAWIIYGKLVLGNYYTHKIKSKQGLDYLEQCEKYYAKRKDYFLLADVQNLIGLNYIYLTEYDQAADYFVKSLKTAEELGSENESYMGQLNLAEVYIRRGKFDIAESEAMSYLQKCKQKNLLQGQRKAYDVLTKIAIQENDYEKAQEYANRSFDLAMKRSSKAGKANSYTNLAITYFESGDNQLALENFQNALTLRLETNEPRLISEGYFNLGEWHFYLEKYKDAIPFYEKSLQVALENDLLVEISDAHNQLASCYKALGDYKKALSSMEEYVSKIKLIQRNNQNKDADFQRVAYELDVEERMLEQKKREDKINERIAEEQDRAKFIVIGFSLIGVAFLVYLVFQRLNTSLFAKQKQQNIEGEVSHLKSAIASLSRVEHYVDRLGIHHSLFDGLSGIGKAVVYELNSNARIWLPLRFGPIENYLIHDFFQKKKGQILTKEEFVANLKQINFVSFDDFECVFLKDDKGKICAEMLQKEAYFFPSGTFVKQGEQVDFNSFAVVLSNAGYNTLSKEDRIGDFSKQVNLLQSMNSKLSKTLLEETWIKEFNSASLHVLYFN
jgi:tetratricopeptide (TPR) repeat protein